MGAGRSWRIAPLPTPVARGRRDYRRGVRLAVGREPPPVRHCVARRRCVVVDSPERSPNAVMTGQGRDSCLQNATTFTRMKGPDTGLRLSRWSATHSLRCSRRRWALRRRAVVGNHPPRTPPAPLRFAGGEKKPDRSASLHGRGEETAPLRFTGGEKKRLRFASREGRRNLTAPLRSTGG